MAACGYERPSGQRRKAYPWEPSEPPNEGDGDHQPNKRPRFGKINNRVVARTIKLAWRILGCLNMNSAFLLVDQRHPAAWGGFTACWLVAVRRRAAGATGTLV
jgi:hypothetical protein